ncbi:MAG: glycosyl transferase, group 1 [uncultured bacterium]|nr:MAG: glycosyl transferase, group 1 [uncultured bacterium]
MGDEFINLKLKREKFILSVSTLEPRKNFITLLRAYQILPEDLKNQHRLKIAGNLGWNNHEFEEELRKANLHNQIDLLGRVEDNKLIELYNQTALFVYPSLFEGFGLPILEAMSCGAPVITSANSSLPEAGGDGALYLKNPRDKEELAQKIAMVLADTKLQEKLSDASLKQAKKFSWDKTVTETIALFRRVAER